VSGAHGPPNPAGELMRTRSPHACPNASFTPLKCRGPGRTARWLVAEEA
jgi:hypothetical protein